MTVFASSSMRRGYGTSSGVPPGQLPAHQHLRQDLRSDVLADALHCIEDAPEPALLLLIVARVDPSLKRGYQPLQCDSPIGRPIRKKLKRLLRRGGGERARSLVDFDSAFKVSAALKHLEGTARLRA